LDFVERLFQKGVVFELCVAEASNEQTASIRAKLGNTTRIER
jgi:hypothetical protein